MSVMFKPVNDGPTIRGHAPAVTSATPLKDRVFALDGRNRYWTMFAKVPTSASYQIYVSPDDYRDAEAGTADLWPLNAVNWTSAMTGTWVGAYGCIVVVVDSGEIDLKILGL